MIEVFTDHGPDEEYDFIVFALEKLAEASDGISKEEDKIIKNFSKQLLARFKSDIENIQQKLK